MITLIIKKEILEKQISQTYTIECKNRLAALYWKIYYKKKGYEIEELKNEKIN